MKVIFFDTETTGLNCKDCKIIELAMLTVENGVVTERYDEFIKVGESLDSRIIDITGITDEILETEGLDEKTVATDLKDRMVDADWMVAHNAQFDLSFIYQLLLRQLGDEAWELVNGVNWLDSLTVLKDRKAYPHKLADAVEYYGIDEVNFHRAIEDTKALYEITKAMKNERDDLKLYKNLFGYNPKYGVSGELFEFIDYRPHYYAKKIRNPDEILPHQNPEL